MFFQFIRVYNMPRTPRSGELPYREHPLYGIRIATIIAAVIGFFLNAIVLLATIVDRSGTDVGPFFIFSVFFLFISFCVVLNDLIKYAAAKATSVLPQTAPHATSEGPDWPSKRLVITDFILAIIFQWLSWAEFFGIVSYSYYNRYNTGLETWEAYANLVNFVVSILHAIAFWKELIARKKIAWQKDLDVTPCENCGHSQSSTNPTPPQATGGVPEPSQCCEHAKSVADAQSQRSRITIPKWVKDGSVVFNSDERDVEVGPSVQQPLLVTPEESLTEVGTGYGTLAQSVDSITSIPETVVKKKDKGKKRVIEAE